MRRGQPSIEAAIIKIWPQLPEIFTASDVQSVWPDGLNHKVCIPATLRYAVRQGWVTVGGHKETGYLYRKLPPKEFEFERTPQHQAWDKLKEEMDREQKNREGILII